MAHDTSLSLGPFPGDAEPAYPLSGMPALRFPGRSAYVPDDEACRALWDKYGMLGNIRAHSLLVARVATALALRAFSMGHDVNVPEVHASGLLHDIAKTYCVLHGGGHAQLGASWVVQETGNYAIAQGVFHHVYWPWKIPGDKTLLALPFFVLYADKRARHDEFVTLEDRFQDLLVRYGDTERHRRGIRQSYWQGKAVETALSKLLETPLHEDSSDCWRMVQ